jgi:hypothetical protein
MAGIEVKVAVGRGVAVGGWGLGVGGTAVAGRGVLVGIGGLGVGVGVGVAVAAIGSTTSVLVAGTAVGGGANNVNGVEALLWFNSDSTTTGITGRLCHETLVGNVKTALKRPSLSV